MEFTLKSGMPILTLSVTSRTLTSACPGSPSSRAPETMLGSRAARSGSTPTAGGAHGGGAFSGRDRTKVDRSAACSCRQAEEKTGREEWSLQARLGAGVQRDRRYEAFASVRGDL